MEYQGHTQTANYMAGPRAYKTNIPIPNVATVTRSQQKVIDFYPAPSPLRRSLTVLPWRPATYYQTASVHPATALMNLQTAPLSARNALSELEGIKVPPVFSAARNALYTRYTPNDWQADSIASLQTSDRVRGNAERVRYDTSRLCKEKDDRTKRAQDDVGKRLGERITDTNFWKSELDNETDRILEEMGRLNEAKRVAEKMLAETENPLHIAQECLYNREKRQGVDLVHDQPEKDLLGEVDIIKNCQDKIRKMIGKANNQLALDRAAQHEMEKDSRDKFIAEQLDSAAHGLHNNSTGINFHNGVENIDNCLSVPETWAKFSNGNLQRAQSEREASANLRSEIEDLLNQCANDMWKKWNDTNTALTQRVQETTDMRNKIQDNLARIIQEIFDMEKNIEFIKHNIVLKEKPMMVAQTRLDTRLRRPNMELCRDAAQQRLVEEVNEIRDSMDALMKKLREAENALQHLLRNKAAMETDLNIKNNTLFIDREKCLGSRKTFPISPRIAF